MDWDRGAVTSLSIHDVNSNSNTNDRNSLHQLQLRFREFLRNFRQDSLFIYRDQLLSNFRKSMYSIKINLTHLSLYDPELQDLILSQPTEYLATLERATSDALKQILSNSSIETHKESIEMQVILTGDQGITPLRKIHAQEINKLIKVPGIVISASKVRAKSISITLQCRECGNIKTIPCTSAFGGASIPRQCDRIVEGNVGEAPCPKDSYVILPDRCKFVDQQTLKLQENPEVVPTGEMPRNVLLSTDRYLVDRASPGTRVSVLAISSVFNSNAKKQVGAVAIRTPYLRVVGIEVDEEGAGRARNTFTPTEEEKFHEMARMPNLYKKFANSIAPSIYGDYTHDIKKAIACLLVGGSRKQLPDGMILRGDINVLLMGDPSTAKSQFLKFVEKVAPVGVYTSGKGSSAAGLTASVLRDSKGEFFLEGGAMVLADGGVVCIDEFDKMRESDRVAIHEAMEQQTISIAKAGITTILNSRASVLAAANPVYGRYDDLRSASENIDLISTILSRFDLIFIVRDIQDDQRDKEMAAHVVRVHSNALNQPNESNDIQGEIDIKWMKKFVSYCRARCAPRLSPNAAKTLQDYYVTVRDDVRQQTTNSSETTIPVTVRQLEALVRISESLAKMRLEKQANEEDVQEAIRLFQMSTRNAAKEGGASAGIFSNFHEKAQEVEQSINRTLHIGKRVETNALYSSLEAQGFNPNSIQRGIRGMVQKGLLKQQNQYKYIQRVK